MKKLFAILMSVCLIVSVAAAVAEEEEKPFAVTDEITIGMSQEELIATLGNAVYEVDTEHTHSEIVFTEVELKNTTMFDLPADIHFLFSENKLVAIKVDFDETVKAYDQLKAQLTETYGEAVTADPAAMGKATFAVDDDGILENAMECWASGNVAILLDKDTDGDVDLYFVQLDAALFME